MCSIVNGIRPAKPKNSTMIGLSDTLWDLLQDCWNGDRLQRPQMQNVEVQVGNAAAQWETWVLSRRPVPFPRRPREPSPSSVMATYSCSSTETGNSSASDLPRLNAPEIRIVVDGPEDSNPHRMQEFYPPPSPISPYPGTQLNGAFIDRLDGVSSRMIWFDLVLIPGLASRTRFRR